MDVREKLVELIGSTEYGNGSLVGKNFQKGFIEKIASNLIAHGVTVQEVDGCEYCKEDSEGFRRMFGAFSLVNPFHGKTWQIHAGKCKPREINFCPMCGRKLPQPPKGE